MTKTNNIPKEWKWVKLGEVCQKISNGANAKQTDEKIGFPISRIETIWNEDIDLNRVKYIRENEANFVEKYSLKKNDILFSHINSDIHLGKTAIFKNQTKTLIHGINLLLIRLNNEAHPDFFNYQFKFKRRNGEFIEIAQKSVNQSSINQSKLKNLDFVLPPLAVQQAIVSKIEELFSELDNGIAQLKTAQQQLKTYRQSVLKWAFEGKLTEEWRLVGMAGIEPTTSKNKKSRKSINPTNHGLDNKLNAEREGFAPPDLPEGWKWVKLQDVAKYISDGDHQAPPKASTGIPFITISNVNKLNNKIDFNDTFMVKSEYFFNLKENRKPLKGDILYTVTGSFGIPILIDFDKEFCFQRHIGLVRPLKFINQRWLYYMLQTPQVFNQAKDSATGTAQKTVALSSLRNFNIPFCDTEEQHQIVQEIESRLSVADKLEESISASLQQAEALRQSILKRAFEGELIKK
jgi:type I restriction enzyme S subunit